MNITAHKGYLKAGFLLSGFFAVILIPLRLLTVEDATIVGEWKTYLAVLGIGTLGWWAVLAAAIWFSNRFGDRIELYPLSDFDLSEIQKEPVFYSEPKFFNIYAVSDWLMNAFGPSAGVALASGLAINLFDNPWIVTALGLPFLASLLLCLVSAVSIFPWFYATFRIRCASCNNRIAGAKIRPRPEYRNEKSRSALERYFWPDQLADRKFTCPNCCALNVVVKKP